MSWLFKETIHVCEQTEIQLACLSWKICVEEISQNVVDSSSLIPLLIHQRKRVSSSQGSNLTGSYSALAAHYWNSWMSKGKSANREHETFFVNNQMIECHEWYNYEYKHVLTCLISSLLAKSRVAAAPRALHVRPSGRRM